NVFRSTSRSQSAGIGYLFGRKGLRVSTSLEWQRSTLRTERTLPASVATERTFYDPLPSLLLNANLPHHRNLRLSWTTSTRAPTGQLQDVVDNPNPLRLTIGNPGLKPSYVHAAFCRYSATDAARSRSLFVVLSGQLESRAIGNATWTALDDTVISSVTLHRGG